MASDDSEPQPALGAASAGPDDHYDDNNHDMHSVAYSPAAGQPGPTITAPGWGRCPHLPLTITGPQQW